MLSTENLHQLVKLLVATAEVIGDEVRPAAAALMAEDLSAYPMPVLEKALVQCRRELKGRLSLAAVLERVDDGHPTPNEAWAVAVLAADERNTVVWTSQTQAAWSVAQPLMNIGDKIAARQAFLESYGRLVKDARAANACGSYVASIGFDSAGRDAALRQAVTRGQLSHDQVAQHLQIAGPAPVFNAAALLSGHVEVAPHASADVRKRLEEVAELLGMKPSAQAVAA
ncbi:hypothetical protein [Xanthomonas axonopodis]|uniref:Uncharacterized protein n=1 Tax=Xanthomonas axonopodis pv. cajani TaxID=487827 RepID=A0ABX3M5U3_9XANT|nr:hypothetical protein [Xanthomonas axonopodis]OOX08700.1 hypothetical protein Xcaj_18560 [Xanthomonas axonopodis pv. cajani]